MSFGAKPAAIATVDTSGKALVFPLAVSASVSILGKDVSVGSTGKVVVAVAVQRGQPEAVMRFVQNGSPLDVVTVGAGGTMSSGAKYDYQTGIQAGDTFNVQFDRKTALQLLELNFVQDSDL